MEKDKGYLGSAVNDLVDFCNKNRVRKYVDLDTIGCIHIPSVRIEESTFIDRWIKHEGLSMQTEMSFSTYSAWEHSELIKIRSFFCLKLLL